MRLSDLGTLLNEEGNLDNIYEYFNNQAFVDANRGRSFTSMEQISIIIHSDAPSISLEQKFRDLRKLAARVDDDIKEEIEYYIDLKQKMMEFVKSLNDDRFMFHIPFGGKVFNPKIFRTYEDALKGSCVVPMGLTIEQVFDDSKEQYPQGNCGYINFVKSGCLDKEIADVGISGELYLMANLPKRHLKISDIEVEFNSPFKPFDLMKLHDRREYYIVADVDDEELDKLKQELSASEYAKYDRGWAKFDVAFYNDMDVLDGVPLDPITIGCSTHHYYRLSQIKKVSQYEMTHGMYLHINKLKEKFAKK